NYDIPSLPADYLNRIGRTARAGASGNALTLVSREDTPALATIERTLGRELPRVRVDGLTESEGPGPSAVSTSPRSPLRGTRRPARRRRRR
ncbi:MAG: RNA helicase, partial [Proteobacteria bacterium]|nr:RNA helicase [Pseudomonadota bacterium]